MTFSRISIVIIVKDDRGIADTLASLRLVRRPLPTDITVVDASAPSVLADIRAAYQEVTWLAYQAAPGPKSSIPEQRNVGVQSTAGDIVVFIDANCIAQPSWLEELVAPILAEGEQIVAGSTRAAHDITLANFDPANGTPKYRAAAPTVNLAFTREVYTVIGGFDESLHYGSDYDFSWRSTDAGYKIRYQPSAIVTHDWGTRSDEYRRAHKYGRAKFTLYAKHPRRLVRSADDAYVFMYLGYLLGLPLTLWLPWYPLVILAPMARNYRHRPVKTATINTLFSLGFAREAGRYALNWVRQIGSTFKHDSLFRNAVFLMSSTALMSVLGFVFWLFVSHLYSPAAIGTASALISVTLLISNLSFIGLNSGLLRFLPTSRTPSADINASLAVVGLLTAVAAMVYNLGFGQEFLGPLSVFHATLWGQLAFAAALVFVSLNTITDVIFIAARRAELHTLVYAAFGVIRLLVPLVVVAAGALGIFGAYLTAAAISLLLSLYLMWRYCSYQPLTAPRWSFVSERFKYSSRNYAAILAAGLPTQLLPTMVAQQTGQAAAAYFAMALTMANLLYVVPSAITNSLTAEGAQANAAVSAQVRRASRLLAFVLIPAVALAVLLAPVILRLFGQGYAQHGTPVFQVLAITTLAIAINSLGNAVLNLRRQPGGILLVQAIIALTSLGLAHWWLQLGVVGAGLALLAGNLAGSLTHLWLALRRRQKPQVNLRLRLQSAWVALPKA